MSKASSILILNGPNLNMLGTREPEIYGATTLGEIEAMCVEAVGSSLSMEFKQSNDEGQLVTWIQQCKADALIINAAAYTHTSVAIHDALKTYAGRIIEVHISNPHAREEFRHVSLISALSESVICGLGARGYTVAIEHVLAA
ncbi:MAG: 3-dehydroquinate dehydratase [Rickettsiales bacterium]|nr:3-dehydroquinate dehydratase [Rickettsiales bacterium]